ncbi:hypothetical protein QVD17_39144 [Tagetes erecta]|uniref:Serpin domain-containing protein n=1 Tax=Tagetes erecta TaxID=13708 RepID=A0AAD8JPH2_TARER|nr:hypothetical protein QVD17_39144 [Tagetes erecta]
MSIHIILSLLATGSNGQTHDKILSFLKMNNTSDLNSLYLELMPFIFADGGPKGGARVSYANGVWVDKTLTLKPSFKHVVETVYKAGCKQVHFQTNAVEIANEVNLWVEKQTDGLITQVLSAEAIHLYPTRLILANAVYFKGAWSQKFNRTATKESSFYLLNGSEVRVPFMTSKEKQLVYEYDEFKVLGLPYLQRQDKRWLTMYFFLPHAKDGLQSLVEKIGSTSNFFESHIPHETREVGEFLIPKFKISFGFEASNMLKELGVLFPSNDVYDFSEMVDLSVGSDWVNVSSLHHKSFVEVNEEGTKASVVSLASFWFSGPGDDAKVDFVGDHPFLFVIREDITGILLFMGQVTNPSVISNNS